MRIDDKIAEIGCLLNLFKNIHPNSITKVGILCNILIPFFLFKNYKILANMFLIIRYFTDILDGAVARKFNKTSKLGGLLDTICDVTLLGIYSGIFTFKYTNNNYYSIIIGLIMSMIHIKYLNYFDSIYEHNNIKEKPNNFIISFIQFLTNNTIFVFIGLFIYNIYY